MTIGGAARTLWRAVSHPSAFFAELTERPRLGSAFAAMAASALVAAVVAGVVAARATGSDAWLPFLVGVPAGVLPYLAVVTVLGGLTLMRPAALDLRAFEIVAWAWVPSGVLALSLLPIGWFAPWPTLLGGVLVLLPAWHLWIVFRGLETFASGGRRPAFVFYVVAVFALPSVLTVFTATVLSTLA